jgi:hypothetical protein
LRKFIKCFLYVIGGVIPIMVTNSPEIITSTIGQWLQWFGVSNIILWILSVAFLTFPFYEQYLFYRNKIFLPALFTTNNFTASLIDIAKSIGKTYNIETNRIHFLLLQGFWNGYFDKATDLNRLNILKNILYDQSVKDNFVWHYLDDTPPVTSWDLPNGSTEYDIRPLLTVPSKNNMSWTTPNCNNAFKELAIQPIHDNKIWPEYITNLIIPAFINIKISQKDLNKFLLKEKISFKSM